MPRPTVLTSGIASGCSGMQPKRRASILPDGRVGLISRRALVIGGLAGVVGAGRARSAGAATAVVFPTAAGNRRFSVLYGGNKIGTHTVSFASAGGDAKVGTEIHLQVKGFFGGSLFLFTHSCQETWRGGQLMNLVADTMEEGEALHVEGAATSQGFRVVSKGGPFIAAAATLTSNSLWTPAVLEQATVVDAQHGGVIGVSSHKSAAEQIAVAGRQVQATPYTFITPYLGGTIWYDAGGLWVAGAFELGGAKIQYQLDS